MSAVLQVAFVAAASFFFSAASMPLIRRVALSRGAVVAARTDRWHSEATPAFGGVGIFLALGASFLLAWLVSSRSGPSGFPFRSPEVAGLLIASTLMFVTGLVDDLVEMRPAIKLALQCLAASVLVGSGLVLRLTDFALVDVLVTIGWFVAMTNAVNLLDNMDGLAAGVAAIAAIYLGILLAVDGLWAHASLAFGLAGATGGFLVHNYPRARIFMGDSGSLFIGIFLAGLGLSPAPGLSRGIFAVVGVPALVLSIPILDTMLVTASRIAERRPISRGGRDHASHRLVALGISQARAVRLLWLLAAVSGSVALVFRTSDRSLAYLLGGIVLLCLASVAFFLLGIHVRERAGGATLMARIFHAQRHLPAMAMALDLFAIGIAYYGAYLFRWEGSDLVRELAYFRDSLAVVIAVKVVVFAAFRVYRSPVRHFSLPDAERLLAANAVASGFTFVASVMLLGFGFSRGIVVIDFLLCLALSIGFRLSVRVLERLGHRWHDDAGPVVIIGSERDALLVLGELKERRIREFRPTCLLNPAEYDGTGHLRGMPVLSGPERSAAWLRREAPTSAIVVRRGGSVSPPVSVLVEACLERGLPVHFLEVRLTLSAPPPVTVGRPGAGGTASGRAGRDDTACKGVLGRPQATL